MASSNFVVDCDVSAESPVVDYQLDLSLSDSKSRVPTWTAIFCRIQGVWAARERNAQETVVRCHQSGQVGCYL